MLTVPFATAYTFESRAIEKSTPLLIEIASVLLSEILPKFVVIKPISTGRFMLPLICDRSADS